MAKALTGYKLFRHNSDISAQDYVWCDTNATLLYNGTELNYADTGLSAETTYYYKLFAVYGVDGNNYFSAGVSASDTTLTASVPDYQPWENYQDSPVLTVNYPYQVIGSQAGTVKLYLATAQIYVTGTDYLSIYNSTGNFAYYVSVGGTGWGNFGGAANGTWFNAPVIESNCDLYTDSTLTTIRFSKTTP